MDTITVLKGNVELDVPADQKERYQDLGYRVIDKKTGKVLEEPTCVTIEGLTSEVVKLKQALEAITSERDELLAELAKLKKAEKPSTTRKKKAEE